MDPIFTKDLITRVLRDAVSQMDTVSVKMLYDQWQGPWAMYLHAPIVLYALGEVLWERAEKGVDQDRQRDLKTQVFGGLITGESDLSSFTIEETLYILAMLGKKTMQDNVFKAEGRTN